MKERLVRLFYAFVVMMLYVFCASAESLTLISINDPAGDDYGSGTLSYPKRDDFQPGDLDLIQMRISRDAEGFWFEAKFRNPIRDPGRVNNTVGGDSLSDFARKGFYQFNIDVYVDTDRLKRSGKIFTLPGRKVQIDPSYAWERAVILTPRPEVVRQQLIDALIQQFPKRSIDEIELTVDQSIIFPGRIKVRGKTISFFVPASFFAGSDGENWAVTAFVTGAITTISADFSLLPSVNTPLERLQLGVMLPAPGQPVDAFGYRGQLPSPVVDLLGGTAEQQKQQLTEMTALTGVAWGAAASDAEEVAGSAATPATSIEKLFQPKDQPVMPAAASKVDASQPVDQRSIGKRLQTLQELFDQKLIDENEYKQQKQRILQEI